MKRDANCCERLLTTVTRLITVGRTRSVDIGFHKSQFLEANVKKQIQYLC